MHTVYSKRMKAFRKLYVFEMVFHKVKVAVEVNLVYLAIQKVL